MARKAVRLADIAKKLNVSTVTVSNALANQKGVSGELREKIRKTAQEMGYQPVNSGSAKVTANIGVIIHEKYLDNHMTFYWKLYQELVVACTERGSFLLFELLNQEAERELELPLIVRERKVDGLIVMGELSRAYLRRLEEVQMPLLFMDFYAGGFDEDCVISDNFYGMHTMTRYLVKKGHRNIAYVGSVFSNSSITDRYFGYLKAVRQYGLPERADWIVDDRDRDFRFLPKLPLPKKLPTAFVCNCDLVASDVIKQLEQMGYRIPEDISIVGYDNFLFTGLSSIGITTYAVDMPEMARAAADRMLARISRTAKGTGRLTVISGSMVEKESVRDLTAGAGGEMLPESYERSGGIIE